MSSSIPSGLDLHAFALELCDRVAPPPASNAALSPTLPFLTLQAFRQLLGKHGLFIGRNKLYTWTSVPREHLPARVQTLLSEAPSIWYLSVDAPVGGGQRGRWKIVPAAYLRKPSRLLAVNLGLTTTLEAHLSVKHKAIVHMLARQPHSSAQCICRQLEAQGFLVTRRYVNKLKRIYFTKGQPPCKP